MGEVDCAPVNDEEAAADEQGCRSGGGLLRTLNGVALSSQSIKLCQHNNRSRHSYDQ